VAFPDQLMLLYQAAQDLVAQAPIEGTVSLEEA
jgi:hypothetical protein